MRFIVSLISCLSFCAAAYAQDQTQAPIALPSYITPESSAAPVANVKPAPVAKESAPQSTSSLAAADKAHIKRVEAYMENIKTIAAHFSQVSPDGNVSTGKFYLQRPGKLRMEYDPPVPVLVITNHENIVYFDKELDQVSNIPLSSTLVGFVARDKIKFDDSVTITRVEHGNKSLRISLVQADHPKDGAMTLEFSDEPLALRNIIMTDSGDQSTTVSLADAKFDTKLDPALFVFKDPHLLGNKQHIKK